ncbi:helix-turn-helix transcriptional regulator [Lentzea tibetensis]|uniref:Helix-turn-helix transcriptional regulator n=2 Tax=Lentzea tibetensis TaxID=2591470 RepID=A0A563F2J5_9PSEU|nr:helix-turn-helix transcriptional regulator [Lentzea tibetensis]
MLPMPLSGFHLRPGACRALFGIAADEVPVDGVPVSSPRSAELEPDAVVARAIAAIRATPGVAITELAGLVGLSERQLRRRFAVEVGLRPKEYARVVRLHRAVASRGRWADIAVRCGCYDQAHLLAEFRKAGCSPADVRFLQAAGKASGSGSTHDLRMARADGARRTA